MDSIEAKIRVDKNNSFAPGNSCSYRCLKNGIFEVKTFRYQLVNYLYTIYVLLKSNIESWVNLLECKRRVNLADFLHEIAFSKSLAIWPMWRQIRLKSLCG